MSADGAIKFLQRMAEELKLSHRIYWACFQHHFAAFLHYREHCNMFNC